MRTLIILCSLFLVGCLPNKEFGRKSVPKLPEKVTPRFQETQKEGLTYVKYKLDDVWTYSLTNDVSTNLAADIYATKRVVDALCLQVGPPRYEFKGNFTNLIRNIVGTVSEYDRQMDTFERKLEPLEGKKVEGSGWLSISYWTYYLIMAVVLVVLYITIKILLTIFAPEVAVGLNSAGRMTSGMLSKAFSQLVAGGEAFKENLDKITDNRELQEKIKHTFRTSQMAEQDKQVQNIVRTLTK